MSAIKIDLSGGFRNFVLACTLKWKHTSVFLLLFFFCRIESDVRKKPSSEEIFVISMLRKNLHFQNVFVCWFYQVCGQTSGIG